MSYFFDGYYDFFKWILFRQDSSFCEGQLLFSYQRSKYREDRYVVDVLHSKMTQHENEVIWVNDRTYKEIGRFMEGIRLNYFFNRNGAYVERQSLFNELRFFCHSPKVKDTARRHGLLLIDVGDVHTQSKSKGSVYDHHFYMDFQFSCVRELSIDSEEYIEEVVYNG